MPSARGDPLHVAGPRQDTLLNRRIAWPKGTVSYECTFLRAAPSLLLPPLPYPPYPVFLPFSRENATARSYLSALLQDTSVSAAMVVACNHARNSKVGEREIAD